MITINGKLTKNGVEMKVSEKGTFVTSFSVAESYRIGEEWKSNFVRVVVFGDYAQIVNEMISNMAPLFTDESGSVVMYLSVEGRLSGDPETGGPKVYQKKDGNPATSYEVVANSVSIRLMPPRKENG